MIGLFFRRLVSHIRHNTPMGFDDEDLWYFNLIRRNLMLISEEVQKVYFSNTIQSGFLEIRVIGKDGEVLVREFCHFFPEYESFAGLRIYDYLECKLLSKLKRYNN